MTEEIIRAAADYDSELMHVDTSDHRSIGAIGRVDLENLRLAIVHAIGFARKLCHRPVFCHIPIAQNRVGFLRDSLMLLSARVMRRSTIVHLHGSEFYAFYESETILIRFLIRLSLGGSSYAVVLGQSLTGQFRGLIDESRVFVVPNGIGDSVPVQTRDRGRDSIVYVGALSERKGVFDLLQAAASLRSTYPECRYRFVGSWATPEDRARAARVVEDLSLDSAVEFLGQREGEERLNVLHEATALALPSHGEGQPVAVLEALRAGVPVVATVVGAIPEMIRDGVEGYLVPPRDPVALADALRKMLSDAVRRDQMAGDARARYEQHYTATVFRREMQRVWASVEASVSVQGEH